MTATATATATLTPYIPPFTTSHNLGPLPTPLSFPPSCLASLYDFQTPGLGLPWTYQTQGCALSTCCPSGNVYTEAWAYITSYYSPGVCPLQYRSCAPPPSPTALKTADGEVVVFCCPTNYNCPPATPGMPFLPCGSTISTSTTIHVLSNIFDQSPISTRALTLANDKDNLWQIAYPIQVRYRSGDFSSFTPGVSTATSSPGGVNGNGSGREGRIGIGAIVGISLGSFVLGILTLGLGGGIWMLRRRGSRKVKDAGTAGERGDCLAGGGIGGKQEIGGSEIVRQEVYGTPINEMHVYR